MPDLNFQIDGAAPERFAAAPILQFQLRVTEGETLSPTPIHAVALACQIRIEPAHRRYTPTEQARLRDVFGTPERWGQTLRPMLWTHVMTTLPPFDGSATFDLPVPCAFDFSLAATRYFSAIDDGDLPLCFLFSGTIFHASSEGTLQVARIPWDKEAAFRLPAAIWRNLMDVYYPNSAWLSLRKDVFEALDQYRSRQSLVTSEQALERLLAAAQQPVTP
jgi:hypothetical protein